MLLQIFLDFFRLYRRVNNCLDGRWRILLRKLYSCELLHEPVRRQIPDSDLNMTPTPRFVVWQTYQIIVIHKPVLMSMRNRTCLFHRVMYPRKRRDRMRRKNDAFIADNTWERSDRECFTCGEHGSLTLKEGNIDTRLLLQAFRLSIST